MNCKHYKGDCMIITRCCPDKVFGCWRCHDEECEDHKLFIKRRDIDRLVCKGCGYKNEEITNQCKNCKIFFGIQYCLKCMIFSNKDEDFFHCDKCDICRLGKREDNIHCDSCNLCVIKDKKHDCTKRTLHKEEECSICKENLYSSLDKLFVNLCGHYFHSYCLQKYIQNCEEDQKLPSCPLCRTVIKKK